MTDDVYYLKSILAQMREIKDAVDESAGLSLGNIVLADNIEWLDCYIDAKERAAARPAPTVAVACERCGGDKMISGEWPNMPDEPCPQCNPNAPSGAERVRQAAAGK